MSHKVKVVKNKEPKFVSMQVNVRYHKVYVVALDTNGKIWKWVGTEGSANHRWEDITPGGGKAVISDTED